MLLQRNSALASTQIDNQIVLMCLQSGKYYTLDGSAMRIWELLKEPSAAEDIYETLLSEYTVDAETCRNDTSLFLKQMQQNALILPVDKALH